MGMNSSWSEITEKLHPRNMAPNHETASEKLQKDPFGSNHQSSHMNHMEVSTNEGSPSLLDRWFHGKFYWNKDNKPGVPPFMDENPMDDNSWATLMTKRKPPAPGASLDVALLGIGVQDGAIAHHRRFYLCLENHGASEFETQTMLV